ncbi:MAG TPA: hypothetical protein VJN44_13445, partial [Roseateles sp.]|nr:hypothetical protein [Roseateles sp.]
LLARAEGTVSVRLTVTDSAGATASTSQSFAVAAGLPTASFVVSGTPQAGASLQLDGSASAARGSAGIVGYLWEITAGNTLAGFTGSATASSATLNLNAAGSLTLRLTVTDSLGYSASSSQTLSIAAASSSSSGSATTAAGDTSSSGGGGGGAAGPLWTLALLLAGLGLRRAGRARRGRRGTQM